MKLTKIIQVLGATALVSTTHAFTIFEGVEGTAGDTNNWPGGEPPSAAIDGAGQKYLNFGKLNTGVVVTSSATPGTATSMTLWAANDATERDPSSYQIFGTNSAIPASSFSSDLFTLLSEGALALPDSRNPGGAAALDPANSVSVSFANTTAYSSYMILFPTVKDAGAANSMQIAEIQLFDASTSGIFSPQDNIIGVQAIPEPTTGLLSLVGLSALLIRRRK
ncbi:PEP-CTERM sorting domain-containing protein [Verrucomicrobiaceae bacterium 227]